MRRATFWNYVLKSTIWYFGNLLIGCIPVLFLGLVFIISRGKLGFNDMDKLIHDGAILFVCVAMIGGVLVDLLQAKLQMSGRQIFVIVITPFLAVALLCLEYLFVILKIIDADCFNITSRSTIFIVVFSFGYCVLNKTILLIREDTRYEQ